MFTSSKFFSVAAAVGFITLGLAITSPAEAGLIVTPRISTTSEITPADLRLKTVASSTQVKKTARPRVNTAISQAKPVSKPLSLVPRRYASLGPTR